MTKGELISLHNNDKLEALRERYLAARNYLQQAQNFRQRKSRQNHFNGLKMDLAWALLDCGKPEEGLVLCLTVYGKQYRERKYNGIGRALTEIGRYDEARRILEKGLKEFPKSCALWTGLGVLHSLLGDHFKALECFEAAIRYDSSQCPSFHYNKALTLISIGSYPDAVLILDRLIEENPEEPAYLGERGNCALDTGYPHEAVQYYKKAMALFSLSPNKHTGLTIYTGLCSVYMELGMKKEAMETALEGLREFPDQDPAIYQNAGAAFLEMGWRKECLEILRKGIEKFPEDKELKEFLKDVEDGLDDPDDGDKPPLLGLLLLIALFYKKWRKKLK